MAITPLPAAPSRSDSPDTFSADADAFLGALPTLASEINAAVEAFNFNATSGTSTSSVTIGAGAKSLTTQTGKSFVLGQAVVVANSATNYEVGIVTAYNSGTGLLNYTVAAGQFSGSGTLSSWTISITGFSNLVTDSVQAQHLADSALGMVLINGEVVVTANTPANGFTIAIKALDGTDPSPTNPVLCVFGDSSAVSGALTIRSITAALSLVVTSGSTLGTVSAVAHRLYVALVDDAGTLRLGVYNSYNATDKGIRALDETRLQSSTAEGGAGAADSANVLYTGVAVTNKMCRRIAILEGTQTTAGTWSGAFSWVRMINESTPKTGDIVQTKFTLTGALATGTTLIPNDDTIPQNTEGDQYLVAPNITPLAGPDILRIEVLLNYAGSVAHSGAVALFKDSAANAIAAVGHSNAANYMDSVMLIHEEVANSVSAISYKVRAGMDTAGTVTFNGAAAGRKFGGVMASSIKVTEIFV